MLIRRIMEDIKMPRVSVRQQNSQQGSRPVQQQRPSSGSPTLMMAKRVYQEQGMEQLKAFVVAIEPFVAPNELRTICSCFGLNFESLPRNAKQQQAQTVPGSHAQGSGSRNQMQMLQMLMSMQNMSKGGMDISQLMKMMGGGSR